MSYPLDYCRCVIIFNMDTIILFSKIVLAILVSFHKILNGAGLCLQKTHVRILRRITLNLYIYQIVGKLTSLLCQVFHFMNMVCHPIYLNLLKFLSSAFCNVPPPYPIHVLLSLYLIISFNLHEV